MEDWDTWLEGLGMKTSPLVSLIIVNWNGGEVFNNCIKSLVKVNYPNWELLVVDNGSNDGSENLFKNFNLPTEKITLIKNQRNLGFAMANNQGVKRARGDFILLLNNDTKVVPNLLTVLVNRASRDHTLGVIQPKIELMDKKGYLDNAGSFFTRIGFLQHWGFLQKDSSFFNKERLIFSAKGACMFIRSSLIKKIGLFDSDFISYFEESDFCWRVWLSGYKVLFYPKTKIYHKVGFTIRRLNVTKLNYHYYKNRICSLIKNLEFSNLLIVLSFHLAISLGIALAFLLKLQISNSLIIFKSFVWNIKHLPATFKKRRLIQQKRVVYDKQIFKNLMQPISWKKYLEDFKRIEKDLDR